MSHTSIGDWIDRQPWPDEAKQAAHAVVDKQTTTRLNPFTRGQWISWAQANGLSRPTFR